MPAYYAMSTEETLSALNTRPDGLTEAEVRQRRADKGYNRLSTAPPVSAWRILISQFANFIIYLLLVAVIFSIVLGEYTDSLVILAILFMNGLLGFYQELRASRSLEALKKLASVDATVTRAGKTLTLDAAELVYGDILHLENGNTIPADARLLTATELQVEESALTGESEPVRKSTFTLSDGCALADQFNMIFSSTSVVGGRGVAVVTACGMETEIGRISRMVSESGESKTPLQRRLDHFGQKLGVVIIAVCLVIFCLCLARQWVSGGVINGYVFLDFAFIAVSLAVAAVPTALPAVVTIALSVGTRRLLAQNMLVRRLTSVETLGSCDVICCDKTGTITQNRMTVRRAWTLSEELDLPPSGDDISARTGRNPTLTRLFQIAIACNNSVGNLMSGSGGNPTELALLVAAGQAGVACTAERVNERPFDSTRKCMSVAVRENGEFSLYTKGAPDRLLPRCTSVSIESTVVPLTEKHRQLIMEANKRLSSQRMRVMAFACRKIDSAADLDEQNLTFVGLQAMLDPPRNGVADSLRRAGEAHIRVIMITGDHSETATAIALEVGLAGDTLTGADLDTMSDQELCGALATTNVFARVIPEHKQRIVKALQENGHIVAMTGDGVNDAPALKKADIGIAVGSGTDVAREAADFVLLDDSFTSIVDGIEEGRGIYENIQKSIMLLLSGNLMEVLIIFFAVLFGFNLPLTALLLLWINLITDGAPALAYSVDPYGERIMQRPPIPMSEGILPPARLRVLISLGVSGSVIGLLLFHFSGGNQGEALHLEHAQTMVFNYIVLYEMMLVFIIRNGYQVRLFTNLWLWAAVLFSLLMQALIMYTPANRVFHLTPLAWPDLTLLLAATAAFTLIGLTLGKTPAKRGRFLRYSSTG